MRYFHKTNNQFWRPVINLDKLIVRAQLVPTPRLTLILTFAVGSDSQTLVPEEQRLKLEKDSTTVPVVDTLAAVSPRLAPRCNIIIPSLTIPCIVPSGLRKGSGKGTSAGAVDCQGKVRVEECGEQDQGGRWCRQDCCISLGSSIWCRVWVAGRGRLTFL